eukprot:8155669-Ditylum_brightwellii.AAC.1
MKSSHATNSRHCYPFFNSNTKTPRWNNGMSRRSTRRKALLLAQISPTNVESYQYIALMSGKTRDWRHNGELNLLHRHKIYMNPTEITQIEAIMAGFFVFSHIKYHSRKDAIAELKT